MRQRTIYPRFGQYYFDKKGIKRFRTYGAQPVERSGTMDRILVQNLVNGKFVKATVHKRGPMFIRIQIDGLTQTFTLHRDGITKPFGLDKAGLILQSDGKPLDPQYG